MRTLVKNGRVIDPANGVDGVMDILVENGLIAKVAKEIKATAASSEKVGRYGLFELTVDLSAEYENPFDPSQVDLSGIFKSPSSKEIKVPGFLYSSSGKR